MTRYAVLGGTGGTGSEIIKFLLPRCTPGLGNHLHVYARSLQRLEKTVPGISQYKNVHLFTGSASDTKVLFECFERVDYIFQAVATNKVEPVITLAEDTAKAIVEALKSRKEVAERAGQSWRCPMVILLSSMMEHPEWRAKAPAFMRWMLWTAIGPIYRDGMVAAETLQRVGWIPVVECMPGGLLQASSQEVEITIEEEGSINVGYSALGKAMVLITEAEKAFGRRVGVKWLGSPTKGETIRQVIVLSGYLIPGLICGLFPPAWRLGRRLSMW